MFVTPPGGDTAPKPRTVTAATRAPGDPPQTKYTRKSAWIHWPRSCVTLAVDTVRPLALLLGTVALLACSSDVSDGADEGEPIDEGALASAPVDLADETDTASSRAAAPLTGAADLLDVRGVGDSGWSVTHTSPALAAEMGAALDRFDAKGVSYRGDLSFMNFESVVGDTCTDWGKANEPGKSYAFISREANLDQAMAHGFNLIGFSNNHTRDCNRTGEGVSGTDSTKAAMRERASDTQVMNGVMDDGQKRAPSIGKLHLKGRDVKVAFSSIFVGRGSCPGSPCADDVESIMAAMQSAPVDLRILALHSVDAANQEELVRVGSRFVSKYGGDVVYGSGPHVWRPVRVVRKPNGKPGVVFESVGNFLHPGLAAQPKNYVGRALLDPQSLELRQVQLVAVGNKGRDLEPSHEDPGSVPANLAWKRSPDARFAVVYANVKP